MAYKTERLERALRLFPKITRKQQGDQDLDMFAGPLYEFRDRKRKRQQGNFCSWIDDDDDEDYDPRESNRCKRRLNSQRGPRVSPRSANRSKSQSQTYITQPCEDSQEPSPKALSLAGNHEADDLDSWDRYWAIDPEAENLSMRYRLRARKKSTELQDATSSSPERAKLIENGQEAQINESSTPKGCRACQELQMPCTLLDWPLYYPCSSCRIDNIECELDPPPTWKRPCEKCRQGRRQGCSYRYGDYDHSLPCQSCQKHGFKCIAGPAKHQPPVGLAVITDAESIPESPRLPEAQPPQGVPNKKINLPCNMEAINDTMDIMHSPTIEVTSSMSEVSNIENRRRIFRWTGEPFRIQTHYPHPLEILPYPVQDKSQPCHWCNNFAYGIVGYGARTPEVVGDCDGRLIEIQDGHTGEGKEPSRMCQYCVFQRLSIINCNHDEIRPLPGYIPGGDSSDKDTAFNELAQAASTLVNPKTQHPGPPFPLSSLPWCSLCREPAFFVCQTVPPVTIEQDSQADIELDLGCGLVLCDYCAHYTKVYHGDLDAVVKWGKQDPQNETEFRADVSYILRKMEENFLLRRLNGE